MEREHVCLMILLLCVPAQYLTSVWFGSNETVRNLEASRLVLQLRNVRERWLSLDSWRHWLITEYLKLIHGPAWMFRDWDRDQEECPAHEVFQFRDNEGYFGQSMRIRSHRPDIISFRVGQVVEYKVHGYRGVIIGWDETAQAPPEWLITMHQDRPTWKDQPNYSVLMDMKNSRKAHVQQKVYVPQELLTPLSNTKIHHVDLDSYFDKFDGSQYLPRTWLKYVYPKD